jgi:hypothetical protein
LAPGDRRHACAHEHNARLAHAVDARASSRSGYRSEGGQQCKGRAQGHAYHAVRSSERGNSSELTAGRDDCDRQPDNIPTHAARLSRAER